MNNASKKELISKETRDLFALGARLMTEDWVQYKVMCSTAGLPTVDEALSRSYATIDWTDRESILTIFPTLEFLHSRMANVALPIPQKLDESLAKDGYQMKKGKLIRLRP